MVVAQCLGPAHASFVVAVIALLLFIQQYYHHHPASLHLLIIPRISYRNKYAPYKGRADITFMMSWPKLARLITDFIEAISYNPNPSEENMLRKAGKDGRTAEETLGMYPWNEMIEVVASIFNLIWYVILI